MLGTPPLECTWNLAPSQQKRQGSNCREPGGAPMGPPSSAVWGPQTPVTSGPPTAAHLGPALVGLTTPSQAGADTGSENCGGSWAASGDGVLPLPAQVTALTGLTSQAQGGGCAGLQGTQGVGQLGGGQPHRHPVLMGDRERGSGPEVSVRGRLSQAPIPAGREAAAHSPQAPGTPPRGRVVLRTELRREAEGTGDLAPGPRATCSPPCPPPLAFPVPGLADRPSAGSQWGPYVSG